MDFFDFNQYVLLMGFLKKDIQSSGSVYPSVGYDCLFFVLLISFFVEECPICGDLILGRPGF